jgi:hypothetical protein
LNNGLSVANQDHERQGIKSVKFHWFAAMTVLIPVSTGPARVAAASPQSQACSKLVLEGEVNAGGSWQHAITNGWAIRLLPITAAGQSYTGWDVVVGKDDDREYPDALLLATPPYDSLSEREIGTTYGLRAQDAIAWTPRHFHFLSKDAQVERARKLFREITSGHSWPGIEQASQDLLNMVGDGAGMGVGELAVLDAKIVPGAGDPPPFARQWLPRLNSVPHTVVQANGAPGPRGELRWMRFRLTLWLPYGPQSQCQDQSGKAESKPSGKR